jgi:glycosyltransferase involved in cell wall biosynthesis
MSYGRPLRVMHVMEAMHRGGAEFLVVEHVQHRGPGVTAFVTTLNGGSQALDAACAAGAAVFDFGATSGACAAPRAARIPRLAALLRSERVDVVNAHNPTAALYGVPAARLAGVPVVIRTEHSIHDPCRHSLIYLGLEPVLTVCCARVVCVSEAVRHSHASRLRRWERRFVTVPNGVSELQGRRSRNDARSALGLDEWQPVALHVGSLTPQKAQHLLLDAFALARRRQPESRLLIVGEGPLRAELEVRSRALGLSDCVQFLGGRDDVADLMAAADLFVLSSVREGLPLTVLEAMRAGLPVVATDVGGTTEAVRDGETGIVVRVNDREALARAIGVLFADASRAQSMGEAGRIRWSERFRAERMVRETEEVYRSVR